MQVTRPTILPVVVEGSGMQGSAVLADGFVGELVVAYTAGPPPGQPGPPPGQHLLTWDDLDRQRLSHREVRRQAAGSLYAALNRVGIHGQPPALMLSFDGLESSVLLAHRFWDDLERSVPGDLVVGVPARDVVIITGANSRTGMEKLRRAVDRVFLAGGPDLLSRDLLVRRQRRWEVWQSAPLPPLSVPPPASAIPLSPPVGPLVGRRPAPPASGPPGGHALVPRPRHRPAPAGARSAPQWNPRQRMPRSSAPIR